MTRQEILNKTTDVFKSVFGDSIKLNEQTSADDINNWDSMNHIILIQKLEKAFGLKFDLFEIIEIRDVAGIVNYISEKKAE